MVSAVTWKPASRASPAQTIESRPPERRTTAAFMDGDLGATAAQKKGRLSRRRGGPVNRAVQPDWEESVPTPARLPFTTRCLNAALMGRRTVARTVVDPARLQHIAERQPARDALGVDPKRARRDDVDLAAAEARGAAAIFDDDRVRVVAEDLG